ncbi:MAG: heme-copper oxidase subunit III [Bryobacteraceae bacterium]
MRSMVSTDIARGGGGPPVGIDGGGEGRGPEGQPGGHGAQRRASFTGLLVALAAIFMFFAAILSAFVIRRGISGDWRPTPLPSIIWGNTVALLLSSAMIELARRSLRAGRRVAFNRFWTAGTILGFLFLAGQGWAWWQLNEQGFYVNANPSSAFFYIFTVAHALHLFGGVIALGYVNAQALRLQMGPGKRTAADISALYWHFMDLLWLCLLAILAIWG